MKSLNLPIFVFCFGLGVHECGARPIRVINDSEQTITSMSVTSSSRKANNGRKKMDFALGMAAELPGKSTDKNDDKVQSKGKEFDVPLSDEDCFSDVVFTLQNGRTVRNQDLDLCNIDAIVVEDQLPARTAGLPQPSE